MSRVKKSLLKKLGALARFMAFTVIILSLTIAAFFFWFDQTYSQQLRATLNHKTPSVLVLARDGHVLAKRGIRRHHVPLEQLPSSLINAVISTEDRRFFSHWGLDPQGLARALWNNISKGRLREGGSTITQQLVKNVFLTRKRTLTRKFRELVISLWLEYHFSKRQILEHYLNRVYFGAGASHGIEAAAHRYFDRPAAKLTLAQSALLAGLLKAPSYYSPLKHLERSHRRASIVLANMVATRAISRAQANEARATPARLKKPKPHKIEITGTEYALDFIMEQLQRHIGHIETDLIVRTTLDFNWQVKAQNLVYETIEQNRLTKKLDQAAAVLLDGKGEIRLIVGGANYQTSQFNRAAHAHRQPGSSFKPFVFLAAMEQGQTPDSVVVDERVKIAGWHPRNYSRFHQGPVTLRKALASSINSVAARLANEAGIERVMDVAHRLGISSKLRKRPSLALGSSEVTPLEMTTAYVPFMNGGFEVLPHIIREVTTPDGNLVYEAAEQHPRRVISRENIYDMNDMLGSVVLTGTGKRAKLERHPVAGKTGTTQDYRDAWFIGYSGYFTAGIWMGNDDNSPTNEVSGGTLPAILWRKIMQVTHEGRKVRPLPGLGRTQGQIQGIIIKRQLPLEDIIVRKKQEPSDVIVEPILQQEDSDSDR